MSLFDFFSSNEKRQKLCHIKNLVLLAMADAKTEESELALISAICCREGITENDLQKVIDNPESVKFIPPTDNATRIIYIKDMVLLMMSDGNIHENEMIICKKFAKALGYKPEVIDAMIGNIIAEFKAKMQKQY